MKWIAGAFLCLGLLMVEPILAHERFSQHLEEETRVSTTEFLLRFLGEIRYTLASYLWLKTEIYHHEINLVVTSRVGTADPKKVGEIFAICRLVTRLDPGFVQAYDVGYWRLATGVGHFDEATTFLEEGLRNNPESPELNWDFAQFYLFLKKDCRTADPYLQRTVELTKDKNLEANAMRLLAHCYKLEGRKAEAIGAYRSILKLIPDDTPSMRQIKMLEQGH